MNSKRISLGTESLEQIHESAIMLWIAAKERDRQSNPARAVYFAITSQTWPSEVPEVTNAIELCAVLNQAMGQPQPTSDERRALNVKAIRLFQQYESGLSPIHVFDYLKWTNRVVYVVGAGSLAVSGLSWWVVGLIFATWLCFGAARIAARMSGEERRPAWEVPLIAWMHIAALLTLLVVSILHILS